MATSLTDLTGAKKDEMITSLATLVVADAGGEITQEAIEAVISASGNSANSMYTGIFAKITAAAEGVDKFCAAPGSGGGGGGGSGDAAAAEEVEEEKAEEEEMDMGGAMDMFGGEEGTGDY
jgi:ribosomal protein L12E/L44/L45/RPP1/RPP2